jgi:hypothetical protein
LIHAHLIFVYHDQGLHRHVNHFLSKLIAKLGVEISQPIKIILLYFGVENDFDGFVRNSSPEPNHPPKATAFSVEVVK